MVRWKIRGGVLGCIFSPLFSYHLLAQNFAISITVPATAFCKLSVRSDDALGTVGSLRLHSIECFDAYKETLKYELLCEIDVSVLILVTSLDLGWYCVDSLIMCTTHFSMWAFINRELPLTSLFYRVLLTYISLISQSIIKIILFKYTNLEQNACRFVKSFTWTRGSYPQA